MEEKQRRDQWRKLFQLYNTSYDEYRQRSAIHCRREQYGRKREQQRSRVDG